MAKQRDPRAPSAPKSKTIDVVDVGDFRVRKHADGVVSIRHRPTKRLCFADSRGFELAIVGLRLGEGPVERAAPAGTGVWVRQAQAGVAAAPPGKRGYGRRP